MLIYTKKRKKGVPIKAKYTEDVNVNLNKVRENKYAKYQTGHPVKLVTNDIKIAIITAPTAFAIGQAINQDPTSTCLYIISGCALAYAITNLYLHKKEKQKKFTIK